ncbi:MAG: type II toxin-antitoxin system HicB family antitoxin [Aggregatilineales bacterium]
MRQVIIYPGEDGYWVAECLSLSGCLSQGETEAQALENINEAIALWIEDEEDSWKLKPVVEVFLKLPMEEKGQFFSLDDVKRELNLDEQ